MRPIPLARVRLHGTGHNICGVSAQVFASASAAVRGEQTQGVVDHITLVDAGVLLFERVGRNPELVPLHMVATMLPVEHLSIEILGPEYMATRDRDVAARQAVKDAEDTARNAVIVAHNTDATNLPSVSAVEELDDEQPEWKRLGRQKPGPKPKRPA